MASTDEQQQQQPPEEQPQEQQAAPPPQEESELTAAERRLREKRDRIATLKGELGEASMTMEETQAALAESARAEEASRQELKHYASESERLKPIYEKAKQNTEQRKKADKLRTTIDDNKRVLKECEQEIRELDVKLQEASSEYKDAREQRATLVNKLDVMIAELYDVVTAKIGLTIPIDETVDAPNPSAALHTIGQISREREVAIQHNNREAHELKQIIEMKKQREVALQAECVRHCDELRRQKDMEIAQVVAQCNKEREILQQDIDEVRRANDEYASCLRRSKEDDSKNMSHTSGRLDSETPYSSFVSDRRSQSKASNRSGGTPAKVDETTTEKVLQKKVEDLEEEKERLRSEVESGAKTRGDMIKAVKQLKRELAVEQKNYTDMLRQIEDKIRKQHNTAEVLERDNRRLVDAMEQLNMMIKTKRRICPINITPQKRAAALAGVSPSPNPAT